MAIDPEQSDDPQRTPVIEESMSNYRVHGLLLSSEVELPELAALRVAAESQPDVRVRRGKLERPEGLPSWPFSCMALADGAAFLEVPDIAQYLVKNGREVVVASDANADFGLVRAYLLGWVMALICHQRDSLALHASAVAFGNQVVAFAGDAGAGKSTMAAHCVQAGARLVADDLLRVSLTREGPVRAYCGVPQLRLWRHALDGLHWTSEGRTPIYWREDKFWVPSESAILNDELPLVCIYLLEQDATAKEISLERVTGAAAVTALVTNSHGWIKSVDVVGRRPGHFKDCVQLASSVEIVRLKRRLDPAQLPMAAARIAAEFVESVDGARPRER
jgi:hypothetical protein